MTRRDDPDRDDDREEPDEGRPRGLIRSLLDLLREVEERGEHTRTGRSRPGPHTAVDYSVSIGGLGEGGATDPFRSGAADDERSERASDDGTPDAHVTTRETSDGIVVAADLAGVDGADVDTRLDRGDGELVIEVDDRDAARMPLESNGWTVVGSRFANGVLEVELRRD